MCSVKGKWAGLHVFFKMSYLSRRNSEIGKKKTTKPTKYRVKKNHRNVKTKDDGESR